MANLGIDYSWARPGGSAIKAGGFNFVCRYLSFDVTGKNISAGEAQDILGNGLGLVLVWESSSSAALQGHDRGVSDAQNALSQARAIGFPDDRPLYFAVDFDEADTAAQNNALASYFDGVVSVIGLNRTGIYSGYYPIKRLHEAGKVTWLWQTLGWSGGQVYDGVHIYQNGQSAFGSGADIDEARQADYGAWGAGSSVESTPPVPSPVIEVSQPSPVAAAGPGGTYSVKKGDTLSGIGTNTGTDWRAIAQINGITAPYVIYPNEVLTLPGGAVLNGSGTATVRYTVASGDTLSAIGTKFGVDYHTIAQINGISDPNKIYAGQVLVISGSPAQPTQSAGGRTYTVASGNTLSGIGAIVGIDWHSIAALNGINPPYTIYPNQVLQLP